MNELQQFNEIIQIIQSSRDKALQNVNKELILMYWQIGEYLSDKAKEINYGDGYIDSLSSFIQRKFPGIKGFTRRGLYRMRQFYDTYAGNETEKQIGEAFLGPLLDEVFQSSTSGTVMKRVGLVLLDELDQLFLRLEFHINSIAIRWLKYHIDLNSTGHLCYNSTIGSYTSTCSRYLLKEESDL